MTRIQPIDPATAEGKAKSLLDGVQRKLGATPNLFKSLAHAPAALDAYMSLDRALSGASLSASFREQIALTVAGQSECGYCASAHTYIGKSLGVDEHELGRNLRGAATEAKTQAGLTFASRIVTERGWVSDADVDAARAAGYTDGQLLEIVAVVAQNLFSNYMNHVIGTEIDFPKVDLPRAATAE